MEQFWIKPVYFFKRNLPTWKFRFILRPHTFTFWLVTTMYYFSGDVLAASSISLPSLKFHNLQFVQTPNLNLDLAVKLFFWFQGATVCFTKFCADKKGKEPLDKKTNICFLEPFILRIRIPQQPFLL